MPEAHVTAVGHENVRATHDSTLEITQDDWLTEAGDCIVGIEADRVPSAFDSTLVNALQSHAADVTIELMVDGGVERIVGSGHPQITCASDRCLIARTSEFVDDRTVMVRADRAAGDLDRTFVARLQSGATLQATLTVDA